MPKKPKTPFSITELHHIARRLQDSSLSIVASVQTFESAGIKSVATTYAAELDRGLRGCENFAMSLKESVQTALADRASGGNSATGRGKAKR